MDIEKKRRDAVADFEARTPLSVDPRKGATGGVLLSDQIAYYVQEGKLIDPFEPKNLKAAGYELCIGDEFYLGGKKFSFTSADAPGHIEIPPFDVAVVKTKEILCIPRFLIARWNLRVQWTYRGLLWIGAAQVDPGYVGIFFVPYTISLTSTSASSRVSGWLS